MSRWVFIVLLKGETTVHQLSIEDSFEEPEQVKNGLYSLFLLNILMLKKNLVIKNERNDFFYSKNT